MRNVKKEFCKVFINSFMVYTDLFQSNIAEDTYTAAKRSKFMKGMGRNQLDNEDYCAECSQPFTTTFWIFKNSKE